MANSYLKRKLCGRSENLSAPERPLKRAEPLSGLSCLGYVSALDREGRTIWIADAHRAGKRFIVRVGEKLTAFVNLKRAI
jgi:hypothetical protein